MSSEYIDSKKDKKETVLYPNFKNFIITIIRYMVIVVLLFIISAGAMVNASTDLSKWAGADIDGPPYAKGPAVTGDTIHKLFNLNVYSKPYNLEVMNTIQYTNSSGSYPRGMLWPWAIRMTALSYAWMRLYLQQHILEMVPTDTGSLSTSVMFAFGWIPLLFILGCMPMLSSIMTMVGAITSFSHWGWVGPGGLIYMFLLFFFPGLFYAMGLFFVPMITMLINSMIQPLFYLYFLYEPLFKQSSKVKKMMTDHFHILVIAGIMSTILSASMNANESTGFIWGVLIVSIIALFKQASSMYT
jgi:hypothetical protein